MYIEGQRNEIRKVLGILIFKVESGNSYLYVNGRLLVVSLLGG